jgi:hypothetical protein
MGEVEMPYCLGHLHKMAAAVVETAVEAAQADCSREKRPLARMMAAQTANNPLEEKIHWIVVIQLLQADYLVAGAAEDSTGCPGELNCQSVQLQDLDY